MAILHRATPVAVFCILICIGSSGYAQEELESQSASGLLAEASQILGEQNYEAAIPYLTEYLERMAGTEDGRVLAMTQKVRLKLGQIMDYLEDPFSAVEYLEKYIQELPLNEPREALKLLTVNLYESGQYEKCVSAATNALAQPLPKGLPGKQKIKYEELSKDEMGGFTVRQLNRIEKEAAEAGDKLSEGFSEEKALLEPDYTLEELVLLNMTLAEAYTAQENWQASIEPYAFVIENAAQEDRKGYAIMQMVNAMIKLEQYKEAGSLITQLYRTNARYDIRVNMALMTAGSALFDAGEPDSALMLYRMVLPREELVEYQAVKMNDLRQEAGLPSVEVSVVTNEMGRIETIFGHKQSEWILRQDEFSVSVALPAKPLELIQLEELVETLVALPPYENDVVYRTGQLYAEVDRSWEAVAALDLVADRDPEGELGQRAFADSLLVLVDPLEEYERVETRGKKFLNTHTEGLGPRRVAHALTISYQKQERWAEVKALLPYIKRFAFSDDVVVRQYECELYYMQAIADLMLLNYELAGAGFAQVLADFPESHQQENATHWHAMTQLFLQNYEEALAEFEAYPSVYPSGSWLPEAAFHGGICLFSMGNLEGAQQQFTGVIKTYPDSRIYPDACSLRGDIFASQGMLNEAQRDYQEAIDSALNPKQDAYAVFQMVTMFEMEERYPEIITVIEGYLSRYGEEADVAKAAYWIGKIKLAQGLTDEAVKTYRETIVKYGGVIQQDGVDLIITELATLSKRLGDEALALLKESLRASADAADNETLRLRIWVLLAR
ncbi:MAG: tetratricopeptide repeat protein, partial [Verrucomicrobia bacterium]|nr:tetratricopeptide repeat protein [Verrucomicrobiota bacterium]